MLTVEYPAWASERPGISSSEYALHEWPVEQVYALFLSQNLWAQINVSVKVAPPSQHAHAQHNKYTPQERRDIVLVVRDKELIYYQDMHILQGLASASNTHARLKSYIIYVIHLHWCI